MLWILYCILSRELEGISFSVTFVTFVTYLLSSFAQLMSRTTTVSTNSAGISLLNTLHGSRLLCIGVVIETSAGKSSAYSNVADLTRLVSLTLVIATDSGNFLKNERRAV